MSEFRIHYENQKAEFVKKVFEIGVPVPSELLSLSGKAMKLIKDGKLEEETDKKKGKKRGKKDQEKVDPTSLAMIAAAVLLAAARGSSD